MCVWNINDNIIINDINIINDNDIDNNVCVLLMCVLLLLW